MSKSPINRSKALRVLISAAMLVASLAAGVPLAGAASYTSDVHGIPGLPIQLGDTMTRSGATGISNNYYSVHLNSGDTLDIYGAWGDAPGASLGINIFGPNWSSGDADAYGNPPASTPMTATTITASTTGTYTISIVWDGATNLMYNYTALLSGVSAPAGLKGGASKSTATAITEFPAVLFDTPTPDIGIQNQVFKVDLAEGDTFILGGSALGSASGYIYFYDSTKEFIPSADNSSGNKDWDWMTSSGLTYDGIQYTVPAGEGGTYYLLLNFYATSPGSGYYLMADKIGAPEVTFEPADLSFDVHPGDLPVSQTVTITVSGWESPTVDWAIDLSTSDLGDWLSVTPMGGVAPGTTVMTVTVDPSAMSETGSLTADVQVFVDSPIPVVLPSGMSALEALPTGELPVAVNVTPPPLELGMDSLLVTRRAGQSCSTNESLTVTCADQELGWAATSDSGLVSLNPTSGVGDGFTNVSFYSPPDTPVGTYYDTVTVDPEGDTFAPAYLPVRFEVQAREVTITASARLIRTKWLSTTSRPTVTVIGTVAPVVDVEIDGMPDLTDSQLTSGTPVLIEGSSNGGLSWSPLGTTSVTTTDGAFVWNGAITKLMQFRARATAGRYTAQCEPVAAGTLKPCALATTPVSKSTVYRYRYFTITGRVYPGHSVSSPVRLYFERYENRKWRSKFSVTTSRKTSYSSYTNWARSQKLSQSGRWRVRAYHKDADHLSTYSGWKYITARSRTGFRNSTGGACSGARAPRIHH